MVLEAISPCHGAAPQVPWVCHPILLSTAEAEDALDERCPRVLHLCAQSPDLSPEPLVICTQLPQALLTLLLPACTLPLYPLPHGLPLCLWGGSPVGLGGLWCCARRAVWVQELQQLCIQCLIQLTAHWLPPCTPQWGQLFFLLCTPGGGGLEGLRCHQQLLQLQEPRGQLIGGRLPGGRHQ